MAVPQKAETQSPNAPEEQSAIPTEQLTEDADKASHVMFNFPMYFIALLIGLIIAFFVLNQNAEVPNQPQSDVGETAP